jgi:hypothetical protein
MTRTKKAVIGSILVGVLLTSIFLPEFTSCGWHLLHGTSAKFGAWKIPVPWGWWTIKREDSLGIQKMARWGDSDSEILVLPLKLPPTYGILHEKWKDKFIEIQSREGYVFSFEKDIQLDGEMSSCLTFTAANNSKRQRIECEFPIHRLSLEYTGDKSYSQIFDSVVQRVKATN